MKRMIVFTDPEGFRFAVAAFDVHRVLQRPNNPAECQIVYQAFDDGEFREHSTTVAGTFDDIMARIESSNK